MMRKAVILIGLIALASCGDPPPQNLSPEDAELINSYPGAADAAPAATAEQSKARAAPTSLAGQWRVAGIDGADFNEPYGIALTGNDKEIWWEPRCAGAVRSYAITGSAITVSAVKPELPEPADDPETTDAGETESEPLHMPVCAIATPVRLGEVMRAFDSASRISRSPANGILIEGGGHSVLLFSQ